MMNSCRLHRVKAMIARFYLDCIHTHASSLFHLGLDLKVRILIRQCPFKVLLSYRKLSSFSTYRLKNGEIACI
jgi:hypothetical protein